MVTRQAVSCQPQDTLRELSAGAVLLHAMLFCVVEKQAAGAARIMYDNWRVEHDSDKIMWLYLDRAGESVNALSTAVLEELERLLDEASNSQPRGLVILSAKRSGFIFGADVREFDSFSDREQIQASIERVHAMFTRLENLPFTTVAAIDGYCLGGGLELALACDYRIARDVPETRLGFPEVQLGIFPGFGGSARSVHRLGGLKAMELMLSARQIKPRPARAMGLVDELVGRHESLSWAARRAVLAGRKSRAPSWLARMSNLAPARKLLAGQMRKKTAERARPEHYPAPYRLIDTWEAFGGDRQRMMQEEAKAVADLMLTPAAVGLRRVFMLMERLKALGRQSAFKARRVHVVGAGVMGGDIAAWCALRGLDVSLQDRDMKYIEPALTRATALFRKKLREPEKVKAAQARLRADPQGRYLPQADVVIEAIFENLEAKQALFRDIEPRLKPGALLASNTSAIPLEQLATSLLDPARLLGLHFFNPVASMPLVEVVHAPATNPAAVQDAAAFCAQINKFPVAVRSSPGFLVNRVLAPYMMEAMRIHAEGTPIEAIDAAAEAFGMPMGPVELADTVGLDVCLMVTGVLADEDRERKAVLQQHVDAGRLGKKSGQGFYSWKDGKAQKNSQAVAGHDLERISQRLVAAYIAECQAALGDGVVADADLLDAAMIFGTGFPPFRGGPLYHAGHPSQPPVLTAGDSA